jgi:hypothetical protein
MKKKTDGERLAGSRSQENEFVKSSLLVVMIYTRLFKKNLPWLVALAPFRLGVFLAARPLGAISMSLFHVASPCHLQNNKVVGIIYPTVSLP